MKLEKTTSYIYKKFSDRINKRITEKDIKASNVYPINSSLMSNIVHYKRKKKYPYFIQDSVLSSFISELDNNTQKYSQREIGIIPLLSFKNKQEALWGNLEERKNNISEIIYNIFYDLSEYDIFPKICINDILCDYIPYAKYWSYEVFLTESDSDVLKIYYKMSKDELKIKIDEAKKEAVDFLFLKTDYYNLLEEVIYDFFSKTISFNKLDENIKTNIIIPYLIPFLTRNIPDKNSLGLRVKDILQSDLETRNKLIMLHPYNDSYVEKLFIASASYIEELENFQKIYINNLLAQKANSSL